MWSASGRNANSGPAGGHIVGALFSCKAAGVAALLFLACFHWALVEKIERVGGDSSYYLQLAVNLLRNGSYKFNFSPHLKYPPGFPLLLAAWMRISGQTQYEQLMHLMPFLGAAALAAWFLALRPVFGAIPSAAVLLVTAASFTYFELATRLLMSEIPNWLASGLAFLLLGWLLDSGPRRQWSSTAAGLLLVVCSSYAVLIRSAGITLAAALLAWPWTPAARLCPRAALARRWAFFAGACGLLVFLAWTGWTTSHPPSAQHGGHMSRYTHEFQYKDPHEPDLGKAAPSDYVLRTARMTVVRASQLSAIAVPYPWIAPVWYSPLILPMLVLPLVGIWTSRSHPSMLLFGIYYVAYLGVHALWPFREFARFMLPAAPVAFLFLVLGARAVWSAVLRRGRTFAVLTLCIAASAFATASLDPPAGLQEKASLLVWAAAAAFAALALFLPAAQRIGRRVAAQIDRHSRSLAVSCVALFAAGGLVMQIRGGLDNLSPDPASVHSDARGAALWLRQAPPGAVMAGDIPVIHRFSGRFAVGFPPTSDAAAIFKLMRQYRVRFLVVIPAKPGQELYFRPSEMERLSRIPDHAPGLLKLVREGKGYLIYETDPSIWSPAATVASS